MVSRAANPERRPPLSKYRFDPGQSFTEVRNAIEEINRPENKGMVAKLTWKDGNAKDQEVSYYYDRMADRFGHEVDKSSIHQEVLTSLYIGIPIEIQLVPKVKRRGG
jgi:methionine aminopeptidase